MPPAVNSKSLNLLFVSPIPEDHVSLDAIISQSGWKLFNAYHFSTALAILPTQDISVIVCERDLPSGLWTDLLECLKDMPRPPLLIVTSRLADEYLWAEALNLGAWDVLAKPFEHTEVVRTINTACQHWHDRLQLRSPAGASGSGL
jgi:DNA-binding response OmpR family regulator